MSPARAAVPEPGIPGARTAWALPALLLLPAGLLAWPRPALLAWDPYPSWAAAGIGLLALLPVLVALAVRRRLALPRPALLLLAAPALSLALAPGTDGGGRTRALVILAGGFLAFVAGAGLTHPAERRGLARGLVILSLLFVAGAWVLGPERAGTLGNTGTLSQAAVAGAAAALVLLARGGRGERLLAIPTLALFGAHAGLVPVWAGAVSLAVAFLAVVAARSRRPGALAAAAVVALPLVQGPGADPTGGDLRGVGVRARLWSTVPAIVLDHPWSGLGPGQFQAAYPPYRDPEEIELSTWGRRLGEEVQVEHVHSDWLHGFVEWGLVGGALWAAFLGLAGLAALRALEGEEVHLVALGAGGVALLANAALHAPLTQNPAAALPGLALLGALHAARPAASRLRVPALPFAAALFLVSFLPARALVQHGRALALGPAPPPDTGARIAAALDALPDSAPAHAIAARWLRSREGRPSADGPGGKAADHWRRVLELQPWHTEALQALALDAALAGETGEARELWERVLEVDPDHPRVLRNLARLEVDAGSAERALAHLMRLDARGRLTPELATDLAANALLTGRTGAGLGFLALAEEPLVAQGEVLDARAHRAEADGDGRLADALRCGAQRLWALDHVANGRPDRAVVSLRQALRYARRHAPADPPVLAVEFAAAQLLAGDAASATRALQSVAPGAREHPGVAEWARRALAEAGD